MMSLLLMRSIAYRLYRGCDRWCCVTALWTLGQRIDGRSIFLDHTFHSPSTSRALETYEAHRSCVITHLNKFVMRWTALNENRWHKVSHKFFRASFVTKRKKMSVEKHKSDLNLLACFSLYLSFSPANDLRENRFTREKKPSACRRGSNFPPIGPIRGYCVIYISGSKNNT